jgi:hypothetical protein
MMVHYFMRSAVLRFFNKDCLTQASIMLLMEWGLTVCLDSVTLASLCDSKTISEFKPFDYVRVLLQHRMRFSGAFHIPEALAVIVGPPPKPATVAGRVRDIERVTNTWLPRALRQYIIHGGPTAIFNCWCLMKGDDKGIAVPYGSDLASLPWLWHRAVTFHETPTVEDQARALNALRPVARDCVFKDTKINSVDGIPFLSTGDCGLWPTQGSVPLSYGPTTQSAVVVVTHRCVQRGSLWVHARATDGFLCPIAEISEVIKDMKPETLPTPLPAARPNNNLLSWLTDCVPTFILKKQTMEL